MEPETSHVDDDSFIRYFNPRTNTYKYLKKASDAQIAYLKKLRVELGLKEFEYKGLAAFQASDRIEKLKIKLKEKENDDNQMRIL